MKAKTAVIQMHFSDQTEENVEKGARLIKQAAAEGAEIICLPELATNVYFPFEIDPKWLKLAETDPRPFDRDDAGGRAGRQRLRPLPDVREGAGRRAIQHRPLHRSEREDHRQVPQEQHSARQGCRDHRDREVLLPARQPRLSRLADRDRRLRRHGHLLRPPLPRGPAGARAGRLRPDVRADGHGRREHLLGARAAEPTRSRTACGSPGSTASASSRDGGGPTDFYGRSFFIAPTGEVVAQLGSEHDAILHCEIDTEIGATSATSGGSSATGGPDTYSALVAP